MLCADDCAKNRKIAANVRGTEAKLPYVGTFPLLAVRELIRNLLISIIDGHRQRLKFSSQGFIYVSVFVPNEELMKNRKKISS